VNAFLICYLDVCQQILKLYSDVSAKEDINIPVWEHEAGLPSVHRSESCSTMVVETIESEQLDEIMTNDAKSTRISPMQILQNRDKKHSSSTERKPSSGDAPVVLSQKRTFQIRDKHPKSTERRCSSKDSSRGTSQNRDKYVRNTKRNEYPDNSSASRKLSEPSRKDDKPENVISLFGIDTRNLTHETRGRSERRDSTSIEDSYWKRSKSPMEHRQRDRLSYKNEERRLGGHRGRSSSFTHQRRSRSRSRKSRSRSGGTKWPLLRSITPDRRLYISPIRRSSDVYRRSRSVSCFDMNVYNKFLHK